MLFTTKVDSVSLWLGDLLIVGIPGEMAASLGMQIKNQVDRNTGAKRAVIGGLADQWISDMLPAEEYRRGGYESSVSFYGEKLGETIVTGATAGASEMAKSTSINSQLLNTIRQLGSESSLRFCRYLSSNTRSIRFSRIDAIRTRSSDSARSPRPAAE